MAHAQKTAGTHPTPRSKLLSANLLRKLFPPHVELVPQLNEVWELELAFYESRILSEAEIIRNGAFFARVGEQFTRHFLMCRGDPVKVPQYTSSRLRSFFKTNQFKTGYGTHGLFPYRGKFHPQMVKGLLNVMGLKPGDTVLDPMMGSGTVLIEATLMGINSVGIDASPFCRFMAQTKLEGLTMALDPVRRAVENPQPLFDHFAAQLDGAVPRGRRRKADQGQRRLFECEGQVETPRELSSCLPRWCGREDSRNFLLLAFLDAVGYTERSQKRSLYQNFASILQRYLFVAEKIQTVLAGAEQELGLARALEGDARDLSLGDSSIDGIVFSPPYSFAIDYLANDAPHLRFLGTDMDELRQRAMIGLRGTSLRKKYELYKEDMQKVLSECARVLKTGGICTIVVGTNNNQLSRILGVRPEQVTGIQDIVVELGKLVGLRLARRLERQITGMANTMRTEYIVMLERC